MVAESRGDLEDAAVEDGMDNEPVPLDEDGLTEAGRHIRHLAATGEGNGINGNEPWGYVPCAREHDPGMVCILPDGHAHAGLDTEELDTLALLIDQHDNAWQHGVATGEQWHYRIARAILTSAWLTVHDIATVAEERKAWAVVTGDPTPAHAQATNEDIAASLAELSAMRDAADASIQRVLDLCARWDAMTKGEGPTTAQIRAAILGLDEGTNETEKSVGMTAAEIATRAARDVCPQTRFPDGTHCGEYGWHGIGCPERVEP
jgi:hypothetical protein